MIKTIKLSYFISIFFLIYGYGIDLKIGTVHSPKHPQNAIVLKTWGEWIETATDGRVKFKLKYHSGHPKDIFGEVEDGNYDAGWSFHGYLPGKFKLTVMAELPLLGANAEAASIAHWRVHQKYFQSAREHGSLILAGLFLHGPGEIMMVKPIKNLNDLKNKKIRVGGGVQGLIANALKIKAVPASGSKVYEILSQGIAEGIFMPVSEQVSLRLSEVTSFIYRHPNFMYLGSFSIFISPEFMKKVGQKDAKAIINVSGEPLSALAGRVWQNQDQLGYKKARESKVKIVNWSKKDRNQMKKIAQEIEKKWFKSVSKKKVKAKEALLEFRKIARSYPY